MNANPVRCAFSFILMIAGVFPAWAESDSLMEIPQINVAPIASDMRIDIDATDLVKETIQNKGISRDEMFLDVDLQDLVERAAEDLASLDGDIAAREIHHFARAAMDVGKPGIFRDFLATYVDPNWNSLPDDMAALNIIAWMPDTGEFLDARIKAARYIGLNSKIDTGDLEFLWKDLRARVERVGDHDMYANLIGSMAETGYTDLVNTSLARYLSSDIEQVQILTAILLEKDRSLGLKARKSLTDRITDLIEGQPNMRFDISDIALVYWLSNDTNRARVIVDAEPDPVLRLRIRFKLLLSK
jgi:hypothetical protein